MFKKRFLKCGIGLSILLSAGCSFNPDANAPLHQSEQYYPYIQPSFSQYQQASEQWLQANRSFVSEEKEKELAMNLPFDAGDPNSDKAILLVHGLGDSPFSFSDLANSLVKQGFYVQVLLLPGHGSSPEHMNLVSYQDWQNIVNHYANLLKKNHDKVWLGGFSTGANLVSIHTLNLDADTQGDDIAGLLLISPGFESRNPRLERLSSFVALFWDGISEQEDNAARYNSMPFHGMAQYSLSALTFREQIENSTIDVPTLIVLSEFDSIIDTQAISRQFKQYFTNVDSQLIWYGATPDDFDSARGQSFTMTLPEYNISTASHMSPLFAPSNHYYGQKAEKIICVNSLDDEQTQRCLNNDNVWFSSWGYEEENKAHARLTWNPYYKQLETTISQIDESE